MTRAISSCRLHLGDENMEKMLSIKKVSEILGVTVKTLKIWDEENKLKATYRTAGKHRRYRLSEIESFIGETNSQKESVFVYCRVSTKKQAESGNLERQEERLLEYCKAKNYTVLEVYKEIASGINDNRRGLLKMFTRLAEVNKIVIEYSDRLARFGYNYLKAYAASQNVEIETTEENEKQEPNEEMVQDLVSIVTCFSARIYGARGGRRVKKVLNELELELELELEKEHSNRRETDENNN